MTNFHTQIRMDNYSFTDFQIPVTLATGITAADRGKLVTLDTTANNTFKLAEDGDKIYGILLTVENRVTEGQLIGTVSFKFAREVAVTGTVNVGDTIVGSATAGVGKAAGAADPTDNYVVEKPTATTAIVLKF